jgi:hypothetical protein
LSKIFDDHWVEALAIGGEEKVEAPLRQRIEEDVSARPAMMRSPRQGWLSRGAASGRNRPTRRLELTGQEARNAGACVGEVLEWF